MIGFQFYRVTAFSEARPRCMDYSSFENLLRMPLQEIMAQFVSNCESLESVTFDAR